MSRCLTCGKEGLLISDGVGACGDCLRSGSKDALAVVLEKRRVYRAEYNLPEETPRFADGITCNLCVRECKIGEGERGFCGIRANKEGKLVGGTVSNAKVQFYHDPLPTNCVADWVCPAGGSCGYPKYSFAKGAEYGYYNLAVFYEACSFDCLFCQNWHYKRGSNLSGGISAEQLARAVNSQTACICYFGGDPGPQSSHAIKASRSAVKNRGDRILRICWETNGSENPKVIDKMASLSLETGGCVKFDLKAMNNNLHQALCGIDNKRTLSNFNRVGNLIEKRPEPPPLIASTLLVPGYIDADEVAQIAGFIASINISIPYSLLAFHSDFKMNDLPPTSRQHALKAEEAARSAGLTRVRVGNAHLLGDWY